jgi:hypothetical protein
MPSVSAAGAGAVAREGGVGATTTSTPRRGARGAALSPRCRKCGWAVPGCIRAAPRQRGCRRMRGAAPLVQLARRRGARGACRLPALCMAAEGERPWRPLSLPPPTFQTLARHARPAPGAALGCPCHRRPVPTAASAADPGRPSILLEAPRRVALRRCGGARRRLLLDGRCIRPCCAWPPSSTGSSLYFPALPPSGDRGSWRRRPSPAAARASCSSLSILLLSSRAVKQPTLGVSAASAVSWCRRNGCGDRHRIGAPRRAAAIFSALSADAAVTSARLDELPSYYARPRREHALGVHCRGGLCLRQLQMVRRPKSSRRTRCSRSTQL